MLSQEGSEQEDRGRRSPGCEPRLRPAVTSSGDLLLPRPFHPISTALHKDHRVHFWYNSKLLGLGGKVWAYLEKCEIGHSQIGFVDDEWIKYRTTQTRAVKFKTDTVTVDWKTISIRCSCWVSHPLAGWSISATLPLFDISAYFDTFLAYIQTLVHYHGSRRIHLRRFYSPMSWALPHSWASVRINNIVPSNAVPHTISLSLEDRHYCTTV